MFNDEDFYLIYIQKPATTKAEGEKTKDWVMVLAGNHCLSLTVVI